MIRDTLIGIILLACLGLATIALGETGTLVASAACATGFLAREVWDRRRRQLADRRSTAVMNRNRERMGLAPIGRASRPRKFPDGPIDFPFPANEPLRFPDAPIIPTRDAHFEKSESNDEEWSRAERRARHLSGRADDQPIGGGLDVLLPKRPEGPPNRILREGIQPDRPWPR